MGEYEQKRIFSKNLKRYMDMLGKPQSEVAKAIGVSPQTFNTWYKGIALPRMGKVQALADYFHCYKSDLIEDKPASGNASDSNISQLPTAFHALHGAPLPMLKNRAEIIALIDRYPDVHDVKKKSVNLYEGGIACGEPIFMQEQCDTYALIDADIDVDFCIIAKGESMTGARIQDGDIVFIKRCSMVDNGDIAAVAIDDTATLKRVYYDHDAGQLILQAENPAYAPMVYRGEELNNIIILGKAMYFQSAVR